MHSQPTAHLPINIPIHRDGSTLMSGTNVAVTINSADGLLDVVANRFVQQFRLAFFRVVLTLLGPQSRFGGKLLEN